MNGFIAALLILLAALVPCASAAENGRLEALQQAFLKQSSALKEGLRQDLDRLSKSYGAALEQLQQPTQKAGKLEAAVIIRDEIKAVNDGVDPFPELPDASPPELKKMRVKFDEARMKFRRDHASALAQSADKMDLALKELEVQLTQGGHLENALAAKRLRESLGTEAEIRDARDLLNLGMGGAKRPALVLRRSADQLEVIVYYDSRGKVSMRSPVENVREETGGTKEKGTTKAKVLGEFVGAAGFEVDPYVSYHQLFDKKDTEGFVRTALDAKFRHEEGGGRGMRLAFAPGEINPHANLGEVLPAISSPGTYRITCRYFVPKTNRTVPGFFFVHGGGGPAGGKSFTETGKWIAEETTAQPSIENQTLLFYLMIAEGKKPEDGWNDYVVLGEITVDHLKFSAFIQKRFGDKRQATEVQNDPSAQPRLISNGGFDAEKTTDGGR